MIALVGSPATVSEVLRLGYDIAYTPMMTDP
jgi:hypothetical protein